MASLHRILAVSTFVSTLFTTLPCLLADDTLPPDTVAVVGDARISRDDLYKRSSERLLRVKNDEYTIETSVLNEMVEQMLLSQEAARRNLSTAELLGLEVNAQIPETTKAEAQAVIDSSSTFQGMAPDQALRAAMTDIHARRTAKRRSEFISLLRSRIPVAIHLEPPRLQGAISGGQGIGPSDASVSIVEFSDFQCPYCANLTANLRRLRAEYSSKLRVTFKQLPLPIHPQAVKAAEASLCAAEQGRFWEMHDLMFDEQNNGLPREKFDEFASRIGLDVDVFRKCFTAHRFLSDVSADRAEAMKLGLNSTPTLFINGRLLVGSRPYDVLRSVVEEELRSTK